jgi:two-component system sensor histidine kinase UhpB
MMTRFKKSEPAWELLEACPDAIELFDPGGIILYVNKTAAQWYAKPADQLVGVNIWGLYPPSQAAHRKTIVNKAINSGLPVQFTDQIKEQWFSVLIYPLRETSGRIKRIITFTHDITQQIRAEERLKLTSLKLFTNQEDERRKIAQDLHDDLGQSMTALLLSLQSIYNEIASGQSEVGNQVKETIHIVEDMMRHIRQVLYELRPPSFGTMSLPKTLEELSSYLALSSGLRVVFSSQEQVLSIPSAQATALYRLVQEGMNNAVKHAKANCVWINFECAEGEVNISLEDDGQGFDPSERSTYGIGLQGLRERFLMLGGNFDVESALGKGTRLFGSLPLVGTNVNWQQP